MLSLTPMTQADYDDYLATAATTFASEKVKAGTWNEQLAFQRASETYQRLLPNGIKTPITTFIELIRIRPRLAFCGLQKVTIIRRQLLFTTSIFLRTIKIRVLALRHYAWPMMRPANWVLSALPFTSSGITSAPFTCIRKVALRLPILIWKNPFNDQKRSASGKVSPMDLKEIVSSPFR